ncbi:MAG: cyclic pyranopterin monophosphate synthase MoaC [Candidatus Methanomethylicia archaeon]
MSVRMVDVTGKDVVFREAVAEGRIKLRRETVELVRMGRIEKGDVFSIAKISAIMAVKKTSEIIPLTHPIPITYVDADIRDDEDSIYVKVTVRTNAQTGVEMEALTGVAAALLTVWDLVKKYEKNERGQYPNTEISSIKVVSKVKT